MAAVRAAGIITAALALVCSDAAAQGRRPRQDAAVEPSYRSNLPPERLPVPIEDDASAEAKRPTVGQSSLFLLSWHAALCRFMPSGAAWATLAAPVWLPLLLALLVWLRRRRPATGGTAMRAAPPPKPKPKPPPADDTLPAATGRVRRQTHLPTHKAESTDDGATLTREQEVLSAPGADHLSIYDLFVARGPRADALRAFRKAAQSTLDANRWSGTVRDGKVERLHAMGVLWVRELALARLSGWLSSHPLVTERRLLVQVPGSLEPGEVDGLTLTEADGLGASLGREQEELLEQTQKALRLVAEAPERPLVLMATASATGMASLLGPGVSDVGDGLQEAYGLWLLLGGITALDAGAGVGLSRAGLGPEFRDALKEHERLVGTPVPAEGCAVHALHQLAGGNVEGTGTLLAAVAGAAFSPSSVVLRLSQQVGAVKREATLAALARLGALVATLLSDESSAEGKALFASVRTLLGEQLLEQEVQRAATMTRELEKPLAKQPLWRTSPGAPANPDVALLALHEVRLEQALGQAVAARERLLHILETLAGAGERAGEQLIATRRLGYAVAGLGMPLLRSTGTELLSAGREALAALKGGGMGLA